MNEISSYYFKFSIDLKEKLDFRNNIILDILDADNQQKLDFLVEFRDGKINPRITPKKCFVLIGVLDVDENFVNPTIVTYLGSEIEGIKFATKVGDVIFSRINPRKNRVGVVPFVDSNKFDTILCSTEFYVLISKFVPENRWYLIPDFLARFLKTEFAKRQILTQVTGATPSRTRVDIEQFKNLIVIVPAPSEQKAILEKIKLIESEALISQSKAQELRDEFNNLFLNKLGISLPEEERVDYYYCGFDGLGNRLGYGSYHPSVKQLEVSLENSRYGTVPLSELITLKYDSIEPSKNPEGEYYYIGLENIESNTGRLKDILKLKGRDISSKSNVFKKGQLMFSSLRPYLNKCFILEDYEEAIGSAELFICEAKKDVSLEFLKWYLLSEVTLRQTKWILSGASYPRLDEPDFLSLKIVIPKDHDEQVRIVNRVKAKIKEAEEKEQQAKDKLQEAKDTFERLILKES